jgi:DNA invertase Pin-like site-specific DNA recombinase
MDMLYIYARVSTFSQSEKGYSIPQQISFGKAKAKELGMIPILFVEEGKSASGEDFSNRPELIKLLALVEEGKAKHIFVFDQTRLSRHNITKAIISDKLKKNKVTLYTNQNEYNLNKSETNLH